MIHSICLLALLGLSLTSAARPTEAERVAYWHEHHTWPPPTQESAGYRAAMEAREREIMSIPGSDERWENWMQFVMLRSLPKFTPHGFKVVTAPKDIYEALRSKVQGAIDANWDVMRGEGSINVIYHPEGMEPKFVDLGPMAREVHQKLLPLHEEWGGMKLKPTSIYGVRLYRNGSSLAMHVDKPNTHVISSILHITHEYDDDNEPWPIEIEDHDGKLHAVALEPGQMLFYESATSLHGRRQSLKGKYYGSIFSHYQPVEPQVWNWNVDDVIERVPPYWSEGVVEPKGSRWAGQAITSDSMVCDGAPPRLVGRQNPRHPHYQPPHAEL